jgi:hypothetical protein
LYLMSDISRGFKVRNMSQQYLIFRRSVSEILVITYHMVVFNQPVISGDWHRYLSSFDPDPGTTVPHEKRIGSDLSNLPTSCNSVCVGH